MMAEEMDGSESFIALVKQICRHRKMYVCGGSFYEVCAYLAGYAQASSNCPLSGDAWLAFNGFVCADLRFPQKYVWPYVLKLASRDDDEAVERLLGLLIEFAERTKTQSHEEIVQQAMSRARSHEEGEPEKTWRRFTRGLHRGKRDQIEPLIQPHPHAEVLWSTANPDDEALLLDQIAESYLVSQISGSVEKGHVTIITDFGPIALTLTGDGWRVDASEIIEIWMRNLSRELGPKT